MKVALTFVSLWMICLAGHAQSSKAIADPEFDRTLTSLLKNEVPALSTAALAGCTEDYLVLDTRSREEFEVSHLENALWTGYSEFDSSLLGSVPVDAPIVCYCSVGYRSERIVAKLQSLGYKKVFNLYGGIFEWVNRGFPVVNSEGKITHRIHGYNKKWSRWILHPAMRVIY